MSFKPNLAGTPRDDNDIRFPSLASPKLDGVRAANKDKQLLSRSLKPIPNKMVQTILSMPELHGLDGELTCGPANHPNVMQTTMSGVMATNKHEKFEFHVFDYWDSDRPFHERIKMADVVISKIKKDWLRHAVAARLEGAPWLLAECPIKLVPHTMLYSLDELNVYEAEMLAAGWEGVMVRDPNGKYKFGRSTIKEGGLLKVKRFSDGEAIIVGFEEEMENTNPKTTNELGRSKRSTHAAGKVGKDTLGAFVCKRLTVDTKGNLVTSDATFNIGTGINDELAAAVWADRPGHLGQVVKFKHFEHGVVDAPRHPVFLGFRDKRDM